MPDRPEPVGQDDFDQHVTPLVPDGTGVGHAMQGSLPPVEWEPVGADAPVDLDATKIDELVRRNLISLDPDKLADDVDLLIAVLQGRSCMGSPVIANNLRYRVLLSIRALAALSAEVRRLREAEERLQEELRQYRESGADGAKQDRVKVTRWIAEYPVPDVMRCRVKVSDSSALTGERFCSAGAPYSVRWRQRSPAGTVVEYGSPRCYQHALEDAVRYGIKMPALAPAPDAPGKGEG